MAKYIYYLILEEEKTHKFKMESGKVLYKDFISFAQTCPLDDDFKNELNKIEPGKYGITKIFSGDTLTSKLRLTVGPEA